MWKNVALTLHVWKVLPFFLSFNVLKTITEHFNINVFKKMICRPRSNLVQQIYDLRSVLCEDVHRCTWEHKKQLAVDIYQTFILNLNYDFSGPQMSCISQSQPQSKKTRNLIYFGKKERFKTWGTGAEFTAWENDGHHHSKWVLLARVGSCFIVCLGLYVMRAWCSSVRGDGSKWTVVSQRSHNAHQTWTNTRHDGQ